ncbi:hypothetical protein C6Q14_23010 [Burkholderia ambifaria]|nr:hypothetical protein C6Q14_23010 [Burkholderia ambifaria]
MSRVTGRFLTDAGRHTAALRDAVESIRRTCVAGPAWCRSRLHVTARDARQRRDADASRATCARRPPAQNL